MKKIISLTVIVIALFIFTGFVLEEGIEKPIKSSNETEMTEAIKAKIEIAGPSATEITLTVGEYVQMKGYKDECQAVCGYSEGYDKWAAFGNHGAIAWENNPEIANMLLGPNSAPEETWWDELWEEYSNNCAASETSHYTIYFNVAE